MSSTISLETEFLGRLYALLETGKLVLPSLPEIALKIQELVKQEHSSLEDLCHLINQDAAITARLMQISNSAMFRVGAPITSTDTAIKRLGRDVIQNIVIGMAMEQLFTASTEVSRRKLQDAWHHATEVSHLTAEYSHKFPHLKTDLAMLAGLLHDIGILPILTLAEEYPQLLEDEARLDALIIKSHVRIGVAILEKWDFPLQIIEAVQHHEDYAYESGAKATYTDLVIVANLLSAHNTDEQWQPDFANIPAFEQLGMQAVGVPPVGSIAPASAQTANITH